MIGAGLGGLATAIRLAASGYDVTVFDSGPGPGGKANSRRLGPYRFDTGPSLFTMKPVFERLFAAAGRRLEDYLTLIPLDEICRYFWSDGTRARTFANEESIVEEFKRVFGEPPEHIERYLRYSRRIHDITAHLFLDHSLHEWSTVRAPGFLRSLFQVHRIDAFRTMAQAHRRFFRDPRLQQLFNRYATYNGSDPHRAPATFNIIPHVEYGIGAWAVEGGIRAVPLAMERLARELGVTFRYGERVDRIVTDRIGPARPRGKRVVRGVRTDQGEFSAEIVVSNADVTVTYRDLLEDERERAFRRYSRMEPSSSGIVFLWGVRGIHRELGLHNILFSQDYREEFRDIFNRRRMPEDPTIYINITSRNGAPRDAPVDGENWFVLVNAPCDSGQDWRNEAERTRQAVIERVQGELGIDLSGRIREEACMTPDEIEALTGATRGSLYGISSNSRSAAFRRHPNRSRRYRGLYFAGGSAHPGGGMPLVVSGGAIVADLVSRYHPCTDLPE